MNQNQTIDGVLVSRELLERVVAHCVFWHDHAYLEAIQDIGPELRALLDADKVNNRQTGLGQFVEAHPIKQAAQPQGEPVGYRDPSQRWATIKADNKAKMEGDGHDLSCFSVPLYAEQPAPVVMCDCNQGRLPCNGRCKP